MLLPEFIIQPVAWSATLVMIALLLLGKQPRKKGKLGWLLVGLSASYLIGAVLGWQALLFNETVGYIGVLFASFLVLLGVYGVFVFFEKSESKIPAKISHDLEKFQAILTRQIPVWLFALAGVLIGIIEPIRLQSSQQNELFLLLSQPSPGAIINHFGAVLIVLSPIALLIFFGWLLAQRREKSSSKNRFATLLWCSGAVIIAGWLLAAIATGLI